MNVPFDPYYKWLGIPPQDQPPDHYRLLGLTHFESDPQVIESAADRQMVHLRTFASGPNGSLSQKLLNEVAAARVCLLKRDKKKAYDDQLRTRLAAAATPPATGYAAVPAPFQPPGNPPAAMPTPPAEIPIFEVPIVTTGVRPAVQGRRHKRPLWQHPAALSGLATLLILIVAIGFGLRDPGSEPVHNLPGRQAGDAPSTALHGSHQVLPATNSVADLGSGSSPATPTINSSDSGAGDQKLTSGSGDVQRVEAGHAAAPTSNTASTNAQDPVGSEVAASPAPPASSLAQPGRRLGLLKSVDLIRHRVEGDWKRTESGVTVAPGKARLRLPFRPGSQPYELHIEARRDSGSDALIVGLAFQGREFLALIDRQEATLLSQVDGERQSGEAQWRQRVFKQGEFADIIIAVHEDRLSITANNESVGAWTDYHRLSANSDWNEGLGLLLLASNESAFTISKIMVTPLAPAASVNVAGNRNPSAATSAANSPAATAPERSAPGSQTRVPTPTTGPKPVPGEAERAKAVAAFNQAYGDRHKHASRPDEKARLARELAHQARTAAGDPADHYVLLTEARQLAAVAGDVALALELVAELERHFDSAFWPSRLEVLTAATSSASTVETRRAIIATSLELAEQAARQDEYQHATDLCGLAVTAATALKDATQIKAAKERQTDYRNRQKQWEVASQARDKLKTSPADASANLIWGKYVCLVRGDWETGLKLLAKGSDSRIREAAEQELAKESSPEARAKTADGWFAVAEANKSDKLAYLSRAKQWYEQAAPQLTMPERSRVEKRIGEINEQLHRLTGGKGRAAFPLTGLVGKVFVGGKDVNLVIHYQPTKGFNSEAFQALLDKHNIKGNGIRIELLGVMRLPVDTYSHFFAGGNSTSMLNQLYIDGAEKHSIDASSKNGKYGMTNLLRAGDYYIRWVLAGNRIEDCSMGIESTQNFQALPIVHTPDMLNKLKPQRAKEEADVSRN